MIGHLAQELPAHATRLPLLAAFAAGQPGLPDEYGEQLLSLGLFREQDLHAPVAARYGESSAAAVAGRIAVSSMAEAVLAMERQR
ncbi:hypothetical protein ACFY0R_30060 [Streptomyces sp. NPDC001633]|uniref:hypothetical protein n=1 Tax=Streptomyces sp. NPDC001633 TaxID=3364595 RepID=UPI0036982E66